MKNDRIMEYGRSEIMSTKEITKEEVTVSTDYKTTLPQQVRYFMGVHVGDKISFKIMEDGTVVVEEADE